MQKKLLTIGLVDLKALIEPHTAESDKTYLDRVIDWFGEQVRGYSISHVNGRFRAEDVVLPRQAAAALEVFPDRANSVDHLGIGRLGLKILKGLKNRDAGAGGRR